jgi:hypothetical protein
MDRSTARGLTIGRFLLEWGVETMRTVIDVRTLITTAAVLMTCVAVLPAASAAQTSGSGAAAPDAALVARLDSLAGRWDFSVDVDGQRSAGELWLFRRGGELTGTISPAGMNTLPVRALTLRGDSAHMTVDTPEGPVTFDGSVQRDRAGMSGIVIYHQGQRLPMTATKRRTG